MFLLRRRLACLDDALRGSLDHPDEHPRDGDRLVGGRDQSGLGNTLHPVARARARRAASAALHDHALGLARASAELQGPAGEAQGARSCDLRFSRLSAAPERGHPHVQGRPSPGRRGPGRPCRADARGRAAFQSHLRSRVRLRGEGARGQAQDGQEERQAFRWAETTLSGTGRSGGVERRPCAAGRAGQYHPGRSRAFARLSGRRRARHPARADAAADQGVQDAGSGRAENVQVLRQHHRPARGACRCREGDADHADRPGAGASDRSG